MCMLLTLAQYIVYVNIYGKLFYVDKTVAYIRVMLYHIYRHLKNDHICEIGRFLYVFYRGSVLLVICHRDGPPLLLL